MAENAWLDDVDEARAIMRGVFGVLEAGINDGLGPDVVGYLLRDRERALEAIDRLDDALYKQRRFSAACDEPERP